MKMNEQFAPLIIASTECLKGAFSKVVALVMNIVVCLPPFEDLYIFVVV